MSIAKTGKAYTQVYQLYREVLGMLLKLKQAVGLVDIVQPSELWDPFIVNVRICRLRGEEQQDEELLAKHQLCFLSGEALPQSWIDPHYRDDEWLPHRTTNVGQSTVYYGA